MLNNLIKTLPAKEGFLLVALSGGADSVYLLLSLLQSCGKDRIEAVHCNFHLRGDESDRDEQFCRELCERKGVKLHVAHFDTKKYAADRKISIELAARELRYDYFEKLRTDLGADYIAVAHHKDDQVETVLHNLIRGTGARGLCGMRAQNGYIIRPLLGVSRAEIEAELAEWGEGYVTDSTNLEDEATRNKIRHHIVPLLKEINPKAVDNIVRMAQRMEETLYIEENYYAEQLSKFENGEFEDVNFSEGFLHYLLAPKGFNGTQIQNILRAMESPEAKVFEAKGFVADVCRGKLYVSEKKVDDFEPYQTAEGNLVRRPKAGDRFRPKGLTGTKLVSDYINEKKLTPPQKRQVLVEEGRDGKILRVILP
ncbi:MAG: tRNA lysidine(34) synthetase TilS [Bacteroidaceae bacterium]|nr:tRNA lysidine(34) synthetase TilS [Bacteroidaceae bacterium]